jgi:hypothetical protein
MKERCQNKNSKQYKTYGGRGITICSDWQRFERFMEWAQSHGYKEGLEIDRINVNGNYEPDNCRWVDEQVQQNNRQNTRMVVVDGENIPFSLWAATCQINKHTLWNRIVINGMDTKTASCKPSRKKNVALCKLTGEKLPKWVRGDRE